MKKQLRIFLAGVFVIAPFAVTAWVIWWASSSLDSLVGEPIRAYWPAMPPGLGILIALGAVYVIGVLTHFWLFRGLLRAAEGLMARLPGVKLLYESVRDLMGLFHRDAGPIGRAVSCKLPGSQAEVLGILTNENPEGYGQGTDEPKVAVYLPFSYMIGGITVYVPPGQLAEVDMSVDRALKVSTMAQVSKGQPGTSQSDGA